jgi:hypothetical protein
MKPPQPGMTVDERYSLTELLGEEQGAILFLAQDVLLGTVVRFRQLKDSVFAHDVRSQNLLQLQRSRAFVHQRIVAIQDVVCKPDISYVVTDHVEGLTLEAFVEEHGAQDLAQVATFLADLDDALNWVHQIAECGRLHPGNVYLHGGRIMLGEPYYLRVRDSEEPPWKTFLSPEQVNTEWTHGKSADIYAGAMLAAYLLLGRAPKPGVGLSEQGAESSTQLDSAFVAATESDTQTRSQDLRVLLDAVKATSEPRTPAGSETVELKGPSTDAAPLDEVVTPKPSLDFVGPEDVTSTDPELQRSVDSRLHFEPKRRRQDTIELDLNDVDVTVLSDLKVGESTDYRGVAEPNDTLEVRVEHSSEQTQRLSDVEAERAPDDSNEISASALSEEPTVSEGQSDETDQFQMVSDRAIFDDASLPSRSRVRDEYDTLDGNGDRTSRTEGDTDAPSPETQSFERPGIPAVSRQTEPGNSHGHIAVLLLILAAGILVYVAIQKESNERSGAETSPRTAAAVERSDAGSKSPNKVESQSPDVEGVSDTQGANATDALADVPVVVDAVDTSAGDGSIDASSADIDAMPEDTAAASELPPATDRKQFRCKSGEMALITRRKTLEGPDGSRTKIIAKAYCVDKYEYPGKGSMPQTNVSLVQAQQGCKARGRRLCTASEWRGACGATFPYGGNYEASTCNTMDVLGSTRPIAASGSFPRCKSGWGTYDMVGNVAEWTRGGTIHGGSNQLDGQSANCNRRLKRLGTSSKVGYRCCADAKRKDLP